MTWTRAVRSNAQLGTAEVWWAFTPVVRSGMNVTARLNNSVAASLTVMAFTNAASSLVGAAAVAANAASGAPSATLITTRADSYVIGVGTDWDAPRVMTPAAGQTIVNQFTPTVGDTYWVQRTNPVPAAGPDASIAAAARAGRRIRPRDRPCAENRQEADGPGAAARRRRHPAQGNLGSGARRKRSESSGGRTNRHFARSRRQR